MFDGYSSSESPFQESPLLPFNDIREFRLKLCTVYPRGAPSIVLPFSRGPCYRRWHLRFTPIHCVSRSYIPFPDFGVTEGFITELAQFASNRKNTTPAPLHRSLLPSSICRMNSFLAWPRLSGLEHAHQSLRLCRGGNYRKICREEGLAVGRIVVANSFVLALLTTPNDSIWKSNHPQVAHCNLRQGQLPLCF